jgi:hypothetical protein
MDYWRERLKTMAGQWAAVQSLLDLVNDEGALANDMLFEVEAGDGGAPSRSHADRCSSTASR